MAKFCFLTGVLLHAFLALCGQASDTVFYPSGELKEIRTKHGDEIISAASFFTSGDTAYTWDMNKKSLACYTSCDFSDPSLAYFMEHCSEFTIYHHYGRGPLYIVENYRNKVRHGDFKEYSRDGRLLREGRFDNWKKVGIWTYYDVNSNADRHIHWFHHGYYEDGISINYTIIPVCLTSLLVGGLLLFSIRRSAYRYFFIAYCLSTAVIHLLITRAPRLLSDTMFVEINRMIGRFVFPVNTTLIVLMGVFSVLSLASRRRTGIGLAYGIAFSVVTVALGFDLARVYVMSRLSGVLVM